MGANHGFGGHAEFGMHLVDRGLRQYPAAAASPELDVRLDAVVDAMGYSSRAELVEHLLERGLSAYETPDTDPSKFEERLRGLGYID